MVAKVLIRTRRLYLNQTCVACPEQYDCYMARYVPSDERDMVAYLRLRHGHFSVCCPDVGGEYVYRANPEGGGAFLHSERAHFLREALLCVHCWLVRNRAEEYVLGCDILPQ